MAMFDTLISDTAAKFGLGSNAGPLIRETLNMVANAPGGIGGFLNRLESSGLRSEVTSWLGQPNAAAMSAQQVDRALGGAFSGIANRFGMSETAVKSAVGYVLPKLIGALTPGGRIPTRLPSEVEDFISTRGAESGTRWVPGSPERVVERAAPRTAGMMRDEPGGMSRWTWPVLGGLAVLALGTFLYNRAPERGTTAQVTAQAPAARPVVAQDGTATVTNPASGQKSASLELTEEEARAWIAKPVYSSDGKKLGEVAVLLRTPDNRVTELHADIGGFLGLGEHRIRIAPAQFSLLSDRIVIDLTAAQAKELPKI